MADFPVFRQLLNATLDVDEAGLERRDGTVVGDKDIRLLLRENRIALALGEVVLIPVTGYGDLDVVRYDIPLMCAVHSHPDCRFSWSRLMVDLSPTREARIIDMAPREVRGDKPIELKTSVGLDLKFESVATVLKGEIGPKYEASRTVYYPEIVSSGLGLARGYWDFLALTSDYLHANRELRMLVSAPAGSSVLVRFNLRAKVKLAGVPGLIPLLARHGEIDQTYRLA